MFLQPFSELGWISAELELKITPATVLSEIKYDLWDKIAQCATREII